MKTNEDDQAVTQADQVQTDEQIICPLVRGECIHVKCMFWNDKVECTLKYMDIQLDEVLMRLSMIEAEITTLQD